MQVLMDRCLAHGAHVCHFTEDRNDAKAVLLPFIRQGLLNNEFCLFISAEDSADDWCFELQAYGIDVLGEMRCGSLRVVDKNEWRPEAGLRSLAQARKAFRMVPWARFYGARIIYDAAWALNPELPSNELCHWEATATLLFGGLPVRVICQYDLQKNSTRALDAALRTHPYVLMGDAVIDNPHCDAAQILEFEPLLNYPSATPDEVSEMLSALKQTALRGHSSKEAFLRGR